MTTGSMLPRRTPSYAPRIIVLDVIRAGARLQHQMVITVRGAPTRPPPGAEIWEGGAEIVMATIFELYLFSTTISRPPIPNSGN